MRGLKNILKMTTVGDERFYVLDQTVRKFEQTLSLIDVLMQMLTRV